jgi:hypothetical protein
LNTQLKLEVRLAPSAQNNSLTQQETAKGIRLQRKMFLLLNKKILTHSSPAPLSFAVSLEPFGTLSKLID